jgi:hypothetical protein
MLEFPAPPIFEIPNHEGGHLCTSDAISGSAARDRQEDFLSERWKGCTMIADKLEQHE